MAERLTRREFQAQMAALGAELRTEIEQRVARFEAGEAECEARRQRTRDDLEAFARTYFPHYVEGAGSLLHAYLYEELTRIGLAKPGARLAVAAPRGEAKSTIAAQIFVLWLVATERRHYPCLVMDTFEQAASLLEAVKAELEANPRLAADYPGVCGQGRIWREGVIVTRNLRKIEAFGAGKKLRGRRHGPHRPDLVVGDDLENDEQVRSPEQRDKLEKWFQRAVLNLGAADDALDVIVIGTILHYDSLLSRLLKNPLWRSRKFQAVLSWPHRMDLWQAWEELLLNQGEGKAARFYKERRKAMDEGAIVSWPAKRPLERLMFRRARDGHASFDSEMQNDPVSTDGAPFHTLHFWQAEDPEWVFFGAVDPSLGKSGKGRDPAAILVGGLNRRTRVLSVVEALVAKMLPEQQIETVLRLHAQYRCIVWAVEAVQFQEFWRSELIRRGGERGMAVPARGITPIADKDLRILTLQTHVVEDRIRFHPGQRVLLDQLRHFPMADHDDGPDALQMLYATALASAPPAELRGAGRRGLGRALAGFQ